MSPSIYPNSTPARSILLISPDFFNYHILVRDELIRQGHTVYYVCDRPSKKALVKILIRKFRFLLAPYLRRYYERVFNEIPNNIDEVFIIKGEGLTKGVVRGMKKRFQKARFQIYLWDSLRNHPTAMSIVPFMDRVFSFDIEDSKSHPEWHYMPNYYVEKPHNDKKNDDSLTHKNWNLTFIGSCHSDRLKILAKISQTLPSEFSFYRFVFFQSPLLYYFRKIFDPAFRTFRVEELSLKPQLGDSTESVIRSTIAILDIHHPRQSGFSHRAVEALASGFKLVTTNHYIRETPYYDKRFIYIIDRDNPQIDPEFLRARADANLTEFVPNEAIQALELKRWIQTIFA